MLESKFKTRLRNRIEKEFPGAIVMHTNPVERRGAPDLVVLYKDKWVALEGKQESKSSHRPLQDYRVEEWNKLSFARFVEPSNEQDVIDDMHAYLG